VQPAFFDDVARALQGFLGDEHADAQVRVSRRNIKVWWEDPAQEHYEAQVMPDGAGGLVLEVGFHSEHPDHVRNEEVLSSLLAAEKKWRKALGKGPEAGPFLGRRGSIWRRVSELWDDFDPDEPDAALDVADRLDTYIRTIEPLRRR
jgi:hypothetical protein